LDILKQIKDSLEADDGKVEVQEVSGEELKGLFAKLGIPLPPGLEDEINSMMGETDTKTDTAPKKPTGLAAALDAFDVRVMDFAVNFANSGSVHTVMHRMTEDVAAEIAKVCVKADTLLSTNPGKAARSMFDKSSEFRLGFLNAVVMLVIATSADLRITQRLTLGANPPPDVALPERFGRDSILAMLSSLSTIASFQAYANAVLGTGDRDPGSKGAPFNNLLDELQDFAHSPVLAVAEAVERYAEATKAPAPAPKDNTPPDANAAARAKVEQTAPDAGSTDPYAY